MYSLGLLEHRLILRNAHGSELLRPIVLVQLIVGVFPEFLHVRPHEHLAELDKVAVILVVDLNYTPRVCTTADLPTVGRVNELVGTHDCERDLAL